MKYSIKKLFGTLQMNVLMVIMLLALNIALLLSMHADFERSGNIDEQFTLIDKIVTVDKSNIKYAKIETSGDISQLKVLAQFFQNGPAYDVIYPFLLDENSNLQETLEKLNIRHDTLDKACTAYIKSGSKNEKYRLMRLESAGKNYKLSLTEVQHTIIETIRSRSMLLFAVLLFTALWTLLLFGSVRKNSALIMNDVTFIMQIDSSRSSAKFNTMEMNSIAMKLRQSSGDSFNPTIQDPVTQLFNYDGMVRTYNQKYLKKQGQLHLFVCIFEIDNYTKLVNHYPDSVIHPILTKIASILNLHKHQNDIVARIDENHLLIIMNRPVKDKALHECEAIRAAIDMKKFKVPNNAFRITVSGGFAAKTMAQSIDDVIKNSREYLQIAIKKGRNRIAEIRDHTEVI